MVLEYEKAIDNLVKCISSKITKCTFCFARINIRFGVLLAEFVII